MNHILTADMKSSRLRSSQLWTPFLSLCREAWMFRYSPDFFRLLYAIAQIASITARIIAYFSFLFSWPFLTIAKILIFSSPCFVCVSGYSAGTEFKITPPSKVYATLGSDVHFRWKLSFANDKDRNDFDGIVWGHMDERKRIIDKYISMSHQGKPHPNTGLSKSLLDRLTASANLTQTFCNVEFVLKNFTADDTNTTYGCTAEVYGDFIRDGPIDLGIAGKVHFTGLLFLVAIRTIGKESC